jgi:hypothetical protein
MAEHEPSLDTAAYREFLERKRREVELWPAWKKAAAAAAFAPRLGEESPNVQAKSGSSAR